MKWIPHFLSPNRTQTHNTSLSFCSSTTPKWLLLSPHPPFSRLISPVLMALNKVKEAVQPSSWKKRQREKNESTHWSTGLRPEVAALPLSLPPPHHPRASGGVVLVIIQVIVEADDGADELPQLHEVSRDDVDAVLPGPLRSDPLHHAGQGPKEVGVGGGGQTAGKARKEVVLRREGQRCN